jgi:hypothetical protein
MNFVDGMRFVPVPVVLLATTDLNTDEEVQE